MKKFLILLLGAGFAANVYAKDPAKEIIDPTRMTVKEFFEIKPLLKKAKNEDEGIFLLSNIANAMGVFHGIRYTFSTLITTTGDELDCINKIDIEDIQNDYRRGKVYGSDRFADICSFKMIDCLNEKNKERVQDAMRETQENFFKKLNINIKD